MLLIARFPEILPVVTKQAVTKMHLEGRKQTSTKYEIVGTAVSYQSVRKTVVVSGCGIPPRINCKQMTPGTYPWYSLEHDMSVCYFRKNRMETRYNACRLPGKRVPGASHLNRIPQRLIAVGGVWKIVHDIPTGQPTVAEPLINY